MEVRFYDDVTDFWAVTKDLYEAEPVRHTTVLSVVHALSDAPQPDAAPPVLVSLHDDEGALSGAALCTPPWPLALSGVDVTDVGPFVDELHARYPGLGSVMGPRDVAESFAGAWAAAADCDVRTVLDLRLYRLGELTVPVVEGEARLGTEADLALLSEHWLGFSTEASPYRGDTMADAEAGVRRLLALGAGYVIWEADGVPVSSAAAKVPNAGASRIGPVYTPPEHRQRGYAAAVTAEAARWARQAGAKEVLLYTDLANPTSNGVYLRIGFRPVADYVELAFDTRS
ncbi:GNAT family N-acetyltransferase [Kutzneria kofuensis]|uniref:GNAT superfamily N-acetyltransferase n=1 Tax=Kutzneria kofuensis TaxID=103725 RepID=A0A7W9NFL6_9PSEU|nr:GNAT family N-acetyltransferase [Kutzneria kofuensis]MBB5891532.1 GNAT superfamily N-acetyltransferase [Kutzneria kofuensis]